MKRNVGGVCGAATLSLVMLDHVTLVIQYTVCEVETGLLWGAGQGEDNSSSNSPKRHVLFCFSFRHMEELTKIH